MPGSTKKAKPSDVASYPIGTAARLAGISSETLRIWERRYQLLEPDRTVGGHRLYSARDVEVLRGIKVLLDVGLRIGTVATWTREHILVEAARVHPSDAANDAPVAKALIDEVLEAATSLDGARVSALLDRPLLLRDAESVVDTLYLPLLARVGDLWHQGKLPISVEHFVEKLVTARLHALLQSARAPAGEHAVLCACPPDERHEAGLLAAALRLKAGGFPVAFLGADLPATELERAARSGKPSVVVLAVTNELSATAQQDLPRVLERAPLLHIPLLLGGGSAASLSSLLRRPHQVVDIDGLVAAAQDAVGTPPKR